MRERIELSKKQFYIVVGLCAVIILANSLESMIKVKDLGMFEMWLSSSLNKAATMSEREELYRTYITMNLSNFFVRIITPIGLALHTYYALVKTGVNKSYVMIWILLLIGSIAFTIFNESLVSIFLIISMLSYGGLIGAMLFIGREIKYAEFL